MRTRFAYNNFSVVWMIKFMANPNIILATIVWRIDGKLSQLFCAVLCMTVVHNDAHTHEQFLKLSVGFRLSLIHI